MDFPASVFYATGRSGFAVQCVANSARFPGIHSPVGESSYEAAAHTTHQLRYASANTLAHGNTVAVDGTDYRVAGAPRRINADEMIADLVLA